MASSESRTRIVSASSLKLIVRRGPASGTAYEVDASTVVGRSDQADVIIDDSALSRRHFCLRKQRSGWYVEDLNSANGTQLNNTTIESAQKLHRGDVIHAGNCTLEIQLTVTEPQLDELDSLLRGPVHTDTTEKTFGGYRVIRRLGEGNMGRLWLVEKEGQKFALKHLRADVTLSEQDKERFLREASSLRALQHQNIVGFVDSGEDDEQFYYVMQFIDGVDLDVYRRQAGGRLSVERCLRLAAEVLDGLDYAHRKGFVHRDVKPANVLVGVSDGRMVPKLTDFGLAKRYEAAADIITRGYISFGTPDYMPPEQVTSFKEIGPASDIYAMGATIYHLLCGETAYSGIEGPDPIRTLLNTDPVPLDDRAPWLPRSLCRAINRSLRREPSQRWSSARSFARRLRNFT